MTIPAAAFVNVTPSVLAAGGQQLNLNGLILTANTRVPIGSVATFGSSAAVSAYFGASDPMATLGAKYFAGNDNSDSKPAALLVAQYNTGSVSAFLRGGNVSSLTLAQLQALNGTLSFTINGTPFSGTVNLAAATSFSSAAAIIGGTLGIVGITVFTGTGAMGASFTGTGAGTNLTVTAVTGVIHIGDTVTGTGVPASTTIASQTSGSTGGAGVYVTSQPTTSSGAALTTASTFLDVTAVTTGTIVVNTLVTGGTIITNPETVITAFGTGAGGIGSYVTGGVQQHVASAAITVDLLGVAYDSVSGGFVVTSNTVGAASTMSFGSGAIAGTLGVTQAAGAVLSQGAIPATPNAFMTNLIKVSQNWANFMLAFDPDAGSGNAQKLLFAQWVGAQNNRYGFVCWDTDTSPTTTVPAPASLGQLIIAGSISGVILISVPSNGPNLNPAGAVAAFVCGWAASVNFGLTNGRSDLAFRTQSGLFADVTDQTTMTNLLANGYNMMAAVATSTQQLTFFTNGTVSGPFLWADSFENQIWMNNNFQSTLIALLLASKQIPYNPAGNNQIETALKTPIDSAVNAGVIRAGVTLSTAQIATVNSSAGKPISVTLQSRGWYLQIQPASPTVRQARASPPITFWYTDGQSVQQINMNSIELQ